MNIPLTEKELILIKLLDQSKSKNLEVRLREFQEFIATLISLTDDLHTDKVKTEYWKPFLEIQLAKFSMHSASLAYLFKGTPITNSKTGKEFKYPDLSSIFLIMRAQIENYLMFYYLNVQPQSFEEGELRYFFYELSGLSHRQNYEAIKEEHISKKADESKLIEQIIEKIKNNKYFQSLSIQKQNHLLSTTPPRIMGLEKLIENSHLDTQLFLGNWKLYSNYAHSEMIGSIQIKAYVNKPEELQKTLFHNVEQAIIPTCVMIKDLTQLFKTTESKYNAFPLELKTKIDFWWQAGTGQFR